MDKEKTGRFIAERRREKAMTQQTLADQLHVTSKAVSKWERGLSFPGVDTLEPLARALDVSVTDILAGETVSIEQIPEKSDEISLQVMQRERKQVKRSTILCGILLAVILGLVIQRWAPAVFQRGNPLPYLIAALKLSEQPFAEVDENSPDYVYITKAGDAQAVLEYIAQERNASFVEQAGSGYIFTTGTEHFTVDSEIYWGRFTVWTVSGRTLSCE